MWERDYVEKYCDSATVESPSKIVASETVGRETVDGSAMPEWYSCDELGSAAKY